jgi:hypothetical protein
MAASAGIFVTQGWPLETPRNRDELAERLWEWCAINRNPTGKDTQAFVDRLIDSGVVQFPDPPAKLSAWEVIAKIVDSDATDAIINALTEADFQIVRSEEAEKCA